MTSKIFLKAKEEKEIKQGFPWVFDNEIEIAVQTYDPSRITKYALDVAAAFHTFYNSCRVKTDDKELMNARISLIVLTINVIKNNLEILGVKAPESM